ncbi:unnamed protein product [Brassica oleracea]
MISSKRKISLLNSANKNIGLDASIITHACGTRVEQQLLIRICVQGVSPTIMLWFLWFSYCMIHYPRSMYMYSIALTCLSCQCCSSLSSDLLN